MSQRNAAKSTTNFGHGTPTSVLIYFLKLHSHRYVKQIWYVIQLKWSTSIKSSSVQQMIC